MEIHPCPICGSPVKHTPRYPEAVCRDCMKKATNSNGVGLLFSNASAAGGIVAQTINGDKLESNISYECYIGTVKCRATEARFGGVVIQPFNTDGEDNVALS